MKERKRPCALTAFSIRLGCVIFLFWLLGLAAITLAISQYIFQGLSEKGIDYAEYAAMVGGLDRLFSAEEEAAERRAQPGAAEYAMNRAIAHAERSIQPPSFAGYPGMSEKLSIFCSQYLRCNTAILVLDSAGEILRSSGDFIYFGYQSEEAWQQGEAEAASGMAWIDLSDVADPRYVRLRSQYGQLHSLDVDVIRITGCWDGSRLEPLSLAVLDIGAYDQALETVCPGWWEQAEDAAAAAMPTEAEAEITISADGRSATVSVSGDSQTPPYTRAELDAMGLLAWDVYFDETASAVMPADAVTIYAFSPEIFVYDAGGPVRYQGSERHENLLALLKTMGFYQDVGRNRFYSGASQFSLWNMIVFSSWQGDDLANEDSFGSGDSPSAEYTLLTAMQASPLRIAAQFLRNVYLFFTAFALVAFWLLRRSLKKNLTAPLQAVVEGMDAGWGYLPQLRDRPPRWAEPYALAVTHYQQTQHKLRADADEIQRLRTALDYAQAAEAERRRMTSSIAHELKTPLAILHSYAEGLQEHIAEEKRDRYLEVILAESERMDALVLEMLDFSRLEAGKVKLERSEFSLAALSRAVFARLERAAEAKRLQITFDFPTECMVLADESRIAQVIENFATNAIKYTPPGGKIMVRITVSRNGTRFCIANDCAPLSPQALHRVWDSFFRADAARSGEGSGLGLAIAKSIIELHGGHCAVHNTEHGVEFSFMI